MINNYEIVIYKIRPLSHDKKLHVFRFLVVPRFYGGFNEFQNMALSQFKEIFPFGFRVSSCERFCIDFIVDSYDLVESCNHDYLAKYLNSEKKIE